LSEDGSIGFQLVVSLMPSREGPATFQWLPDCRKLCPQHDPRCRAHPGRSTTVSAHRRFALPTAPSPPQSWRSRSKPSSPVLPERTGLSAAESFAELADLMSNGSRYVY
jgi:hypothetical protein